MLSKARYAILGSLFLGAVALVPFRPLKVSGHSMEPTLRDGEVYLLDQFYWRSSGVRRGDIVMVRHVGEYWVKRLVGMPGDHLEIARRYNGWIAGIVNRTADPSAPPAEGPVEERVVGPDEIYVVGDNLNRSVDSTNQEAGAFHTDDIQGVVRTFSLRRAFPYRRHL